MSVEYEDGVAAHQRGDFTIAMRLWRPLAEQGNADAQCSLGFMYDNGRGVPQDEAAAVDWYRKAADQSHAGAQFNLGRMYAHGRGVQQDDTAAANWYSKAANQGHGGAQSDYDAAIRINPSLTQAISARAAEDSLLNKLGLSRAIRQHAEDGAGKTEVAGNTSHLVSNATMSTTPITRSKKPSERTGAEILETRETVSQHLKLAFDKLTTTQKIIIVAALAWAAYSLMSSFEIAPAPTLTSRCHTVREAEYCRWSDGTYSMMMPDGTFYTRNTVNDPWEVAEPDSDGPDRY